MTYIDDLHAYEDNEQAIEISKPKAILLPYDPESGLVTRGPHQGLRVGDATWAIRDGLLAAGRESVAQYTHIRPWWRLWRETPAIEITPCTRPLFQQAFDDGGPH